MKINSQPAVFKVTKNSIKYLLAMFLMTALVSCNRSDKSESIREKLKGTWMLDSVSTPSGKYYKVTTKNTFRFVNESDYSYDWMNDDVGNKDSGQYAVTVNSQRALATLSFIPNIKINHKDTIRIRYLNFDIVDLSSDKLHTIDQTEFIERKGMPPIIFNKHSIYRRVKSK